MAQLEATGTAAEQQLRPVHQGSKLKAVRPGG
jgi:hypothetical protein